MIQPQEMGGLCLSGRADNLHRKAPRFIPCHGELKGSSLRVLTMFVVGDEYLPRVMIIKVVLFLGVKSVYYHDVHPSSLSQSSGGSISYQSLLTLLREVEDTISEPSSLEENHR